MGTGTLAKVPVPIGKSVLFFSYNLFYLLLISTPFGFSFLFLYFLSKMICPVSCTVTGVSPQFSRISISSAPDPVLCTVQVGLPCILPGNGNTGSLRPVLFFV